MPKISGDQGTYNRAIKWIACNDEDALESDSDLVAISEQVTVCLVSDMFGVKPATIAREVLDIRQNMA